MPSAGTEASPLSPSVASSVATAAALRARVLARWPSLHAFCRAHPELTRSTVYMVLAGQYPGNMDRQLAVIERALDAPPQKEDTPPPPSAAVMAEALQRIRCGECRKYGRRQCPRCRTRTEKEARELFARLYQ